MLIYQRTDCPFCWKVRLALAELGIEYQTVDTSLGEKHPEVQRLSPAGTVPVMVDGELAIWESAVILDYLDGRYAPGRLIPADLTPAIRVRLLQVYSDRQVGACLSKLVFERRSKPARDWDRNLIAAAEESWRRCQSWLESQLDGRDCFGEAFGAADCALAVRCGVAEAYGAGVGPEYPALYRWYQATKTRPAWSAAYPAGFIRAE